jgi:6-phosphogluconate dehydrogenase
MGPNGAGHFVKMVHNGVEYGMMQAYAEGFQILEKSAYGLDLLKVSKVWQHGSVVRSWLLDLMVNALEKDPKLEGLEGWVDDSGEGRWTIEAAIDEDVPATVIAFALFSRFYSYANSFSWRVLAALRNEFGGHAVHVGGQPANVRSSPVTAAAWTEPVALDVSISPRDGEVAVPITTAASPCAIVIFGARAT